MTNSSRIFVAGAPTFIGSALVRQLEAHGYRNVTGAGPDHPDLRDAGAVDAFMAGTRPEYVFVAAGRSAGITANQKFPADLILDNLLIAAHVIDAAFRHGVGKLLYLASSCSYPKLCPQPMRVAALLTGPLEATNEAYAVAKIAGIKLCEAYRKQHGVDFVAGIPADAFGPGDDFSPEDSHVVAGLMRRMHEARLTGARELVVWGSGNQRREFIFVDDLARACITVMRDYAGGDTLNLGGGYDMSIHDLAIALKRIVGFDGTLRFDTSRPDGMPFKALEASRLHALGWKAGTSFETALERTYEWFIEQESLLARPV